MTELIRPSPPILGATTVRDEYGHVARQKCPCGSNYLVYDERIEGAREGTQESTQGGVSEGNKERAGDRVHVLLARCLNPDCHKTVSFRFSLTSDLCTGGLGRVITGALNSADPGRLFPGIRVSAQIAIGLVSMWTAARAAGCKPEALEKLVADAIRHTDVSIDPADVTRRLAAIAPHFDAVAAALQRECFEPPPAPVAGPEAGPEAA